MTNLVVLPGAGIEPEGDLILADVARESASEVLQELRDLGLEERGSIAVEDVDLSLSRAAERAQELAPGEGSDAVVWEDLEARAGEESSLSGAYLVLFSVATTLAGIAVILDSAILVIGAMIVGPEFGALAGICAGIVLRRWQRRPAGVGGAGGRVRRRDRGGDRVGVAARAARARRPGGAVRAASRRPASSTCPTRCPSSSPSSRGSRGCRR